MRNARRVGLLLCWLLLLTGCAHGDPIVVESMPSATPHPTEPAQPTPEVIEVVTPTPSPAPLDLSPYRITSDGLYDILPLVEEPGRKLLYAGFCREQTLLLLLTDEAGETLIWEHFDLWTGDRAVLRTEPAQGPIASGEQFLFYDTDPPLYWDTETDRVVSLSPDYATATEFSVSEHSSAEIFRDGESILLFDTAARALYRIAPDGTETELFSVGWRYRYLYPVSISADRRYLTFSATDAYLDENVTVLVDLSDGSIVGQQPGETHIAFSESRRATLTRRYEWTDDTGYTTLELACADDLDANESRRSVLVREYFYPSLYDVPGGFLAEVWETDYKLYFWDDGATTETSAAIPMDRYSDVAAELAEIPYDAVSEEDEWDGEDGDGGMPYPCLTTGCAAGNCALASMRYGRHLIGLLLWDHSQSAVRTLDCMTYAEPLFAPVPVFDTTPERYAARVDAIAAQYGITVLIGDAARVAIASYAADIATIEEALPEIDAALETLESVLALYPPDYFRMLRDGSGDELIFELCGTIRSTSPYAIDYPSAVTFHADGSRVIVINVYYASDLRYTLFHEISHLTDHHLDAAAYETPAWSWAGWEALNPKDFSYYYAYVDEDGFSYEFTGSTKYTPLHSDYAEKNKRKSVYFADRYSKTYPTEDRAVLMGMLMNDEDPAVLSCPHLLAKLTYYAAAIRAVMDPDGTHWPEPTSWETKIEALR